MELLTKPAPPAYDDMLLQSGVETAEASLKRTVRSLISRLTPLIIRDRRRYARHPLPLLMELTPVDAETTVPVGDSLVVVGKSLSEHGIGFFHQHAIPYRCAVLRVEDDSGRELAFLVDLAWCRYTRHGWYESGGRFLKVFEAEDLQQSA